MKNEEAVTDCNQLKLREALLKILGIADHLLMQYSFPNVSVVIEISELKKIAKAALFAPARNCDLYKTLDDARNAFFADYVPDETCSSATAFAMWLFDEEKGANDEQ